MPAIKVRNLVKEYNGVKALKGVSFTVEKGEIFGLLGPNGAGKTTLMNIIIGILQPTSGEVEVLGVKVVENPRRVKELVGFCPQEPIAYEDLNAWENMFFYASLYGVSKSKAKERAKMLLEKTGLLEAAKRRVKTYSGGMMKRLNIAIALVNNPKILILDEPTTGLDPTIRREIWSLIRELKEEGKTILLATHYMEEADQLSDRVAIMNEGTIVALDTPEALKRMVGGSSIIEIALSRDAPGIEETLARYSKERVVSENGVYKVFVEDPDSALPSIISDIIGLGGRVSEVRVKEPTLEDVY